MFRKKVHPESSTAAHKSTKHRKNENKKKIINDGGHTKGDLGHPDEDSSAIREHWIKTDADCKYAMSIFLHVYFQLISISILN